MRLQYWDGIPVHRELLLLPNVICAKRSFNIAISYQALGAPKSNTEGHIFRLNCKAATDIR